MRITEEEALRLGFVKDGKGNWQTCVSSRNPGEVPELESDPSASKKEGYGDEKDNEQGCRRSYRIVVTAKFRRHVDPDNCNPKWFVDRLREFGIIPDDSSKYVKEFVKRVVKVESWEPEVTEIEVYEIEGA